jgi:hypothetical protein
VGVFISVRVDNKNSAPTTIFTRGVSVALHDEIDKGFGQTTISPAGHFDLRMSEQQNRYDIGGSSSAELLVYARRYNPTRIDEYLSPDPLTITLELGETFGNRRRLTGPLSLKQVLKQ